MIDKKWNWLVELAEKESENIKRELHVSDFNNIYDFGFEAGKSVGRYVMIMDIIKRLMEEG